MPDRHEPRVPALPPAEWTDRARDVFAFWEGEEGRRHGSRSNTMMTMAQHPELALAVLELGRYMLVASTLSARQREIVMLRLSWRFDVDYEWAHHVQSARQVGMGDAEFAALREPGPSPVWPATDQALVDAVDQLSTTGRIAEPTWSALALTLDRRGLMDLVYAIGFFTMNIWAVGTMGVPLEPDFAAFSRSAEQMLAERE